MTPGEQRDSVDQLVGPLSPRNQYIFLVLVLERLFVICRETFADGLPTKSISYDDVNAAMDSLWRRIDEPRQVPEVALESRAWRPVISGQVEHRPGAALGFHVSELITALATAELDRQLADLLEMAWEAMFTSLYRQPEHPDYSRPISQTELDSGLNWSLLREFEVQIQTLEALLVTDGLDVDGLRAESRIVASAIARRDYDFLVRS